MKTVRRGEILRINLNPTQGRERGLETADSKAGGTLQRSGEARPCLILSSSKFNAKRKGIVIASPITNTVKPKIKTLVQLPSGIKVTGSVMAEQVRTLDLNQRWWKSTGVLLEKKFVDRIAHIISQLISQ